MRRFRSGAALAVLALAVQAAWAFADGLEIKGQTSVGPYRLVKLSAAGVPDKAGVLWKVRPVKDDPNAPAAIDWASKKNVRAIEWVAPPGSYRVELTVVTTGAGGEAELDGAEVVVTITAPPGPTPPGPTPTPTPDQNAPFAGLDGLRVLVVYESGDLSKLPAARQGAIYAKQVRDYLNQKCPVGPDGKTREWRMYDQNVDLSGESKTWQDALKLPRTGLPWVYVGNGKAGYSGPLPANADEMMALLKKYGG